MLTILYIITYYRVFSKFILKKRFKEMNGVRCSENKDKRKDNFKDFTIVGYRVNCYNTFYAFLERTCVKGLGMRLQMQGLDPAQKLQANPGKKGRDSSVCRR